MLPDNIASSYSRYKADTNTFVTWLHATAIASGYNAPITTITNPLSETSANIPPPTGGRLKGKARKDAKAKIDKESETKKSEPKRVLPTIQLIKQAQAVVASQKRVQVPISIQRLLQEAIQARKRCAKWFMNVLTEDKEREKLDKSNHSHEYFIKVLEKTFDILKPCFEVPKMRQASVVDETNEDVSGDDINNRFESLEVEDIDEDTYDALPSVSQQKKSKVDNLELEMDVDVDLPFVVFCFYEDLHYLRNFLLETWCQVQLARKSEEEHARFFPSLKDGSYRKITSKIYPVRFFTRMTLPSNLTQEQHIEMVEKELEKRWSFEEELKDGGETEGKVGDGNMNNGRMPSGGYVETQQGNLSFDEFVFTSVFHSLEKCRTMIKYGELPTVMPLALLYVAEPALIPANRIPTFEDDLLSQIMLEMDLLVMFGKLPAKQIEKARRAGMLEKRGDGYVKINGVSDEITKALEAVRGFEEQRELSVAQVFMARIQLDILSILGADKACGIHEDLVKRAVAADARLEITWTVNMKGLDGTDRCDQTGEELKEKWGREKSIIAAVCLSNQVNSIIMRPPLVALKHLGFGKALTEEFDHWSEDAITYMRKAGVVIKKLVPSPDPLFFFRSMPLYCGLEALRTTAELHNLGTNLANDFFSFVVIAHLYNALQLSGYLQSQWPLMDQAIQANLSCVFNGSLPDTMKKCTSRLFLSIGIPAEFFSRKYHHEIPDFFSVVKKRKPKALIEASYISNCLQRYFAGDVSGEKLLFDIQKKGKQSQAQRKRSPTRNQLLTQLRDNTQECIPILDMDMITLVRKCNSLLDRFRGHSKSTKAMPNPGILRFDVECLQIWNIVAVMDILHELEESEFRHDRPSISGGRAKLTPESDEKTQVALAVEAIQDLLRDANKDFKNVKVEPFNVIAATEKHGLSFQPSAHQLNRMRDIMSFGLPQ
ncbi:hypothetical protein EG329_008280 [Mollisiaceae sp. DMI_Dod_QoI]|nr:hypothetical protein EG329_008280 [Helotiales sp. DMI_Dod_QoI]